MSAPATSSHAEQWWWTVVSSLLVATTLFLWERSPSAVEWLLAKEGPVEQLSHLVLLVGAIVWALLARQPPRAVALASTLLTVLLLLEEIDWGAIYGIELLGVALERGVGDANLHNLWSGGSYALFAVPAAAFFAASARWLGPHAPSAGERIVAFGCGVLLALTSRAREAVAQEGLECLFYATLLACGVRHLRDAARASPSRADPDSSSPATIRR